MRKKTIRNIALAASGAAVLVAAPAVLAQAITTTKPQSGVTVNTVSNGSFPQIRFTAATYPTYADNRTKASPVAYEAGDANTITTALRNATTAAALPVAANDLSLSLLDQLLSQRLTSFADAGISYLQSDAGAYAKRFYDVNEAAFNVTGAQPTVVRNAVNTKLAYGVSGSFTFTNTRQINVPLKDPDGNVLVTEVAPGQTVTYTFNSSPNATIQAIATPGDNGTVNISWQVQELYVTVAGKNVPTTRYVRENVVLTNDSSLNITLDGAIPGINPYDAKAQLVGANKKFSAALITPDQVRADAERLFQNAFNATKTGAALLSSLLDSAVRRRGTAYSVANLIADNAKTISQFAVALMPELGQSTNANTPPAVNLIEALLGSYSQNATRQTLYDTLYTYRNTIVSLIAENLRNYPSYAQAAKTFLGDVKSGTDLFNKVNQLDAQIRGFLSGTSAEPLLKLTTALSASKDVYALDLLSDPDVANALLDMFLATPAGDAAPGLTQFVANYKTFFLNLLKAANNPIDTFIVGMFGNGGQMFRDFLNVLSSSLDQVTPQMSVLLEAFIYANPTFNNNTTLLNTTYTFFSAVAQLFAPANLNKVTFTLQPGNPALAVTNSSDGRDVIVNNMRIGYVLNVNNLTITNGFLNALLGFFPTEPLSQTLDRFVAPEMRNIQTKAEDAINQELKKMWYSFIIPGDAAHNIAFGPKDMPNANVVYFILNAIKTGMAKDATLQSLAREIVFGTSSIINNPGFLNQPFAQLNGTVNISYSGSGLYALPYYRRNLIGSLKMDYQLLGGQLNIDATNLAANSKFFVSSTTLSSADTPVITAYYLSEVLQKSVRELALGFVAHTVNRPYNLNTRLVLAPTQQAESRFALDPNNPNENIAVGSVKPGYTARVSDAYNTTNQAQTIAQQISPNWSYSGNLPVLNSNGYSALVNAISLSDELTKNYRAYIPSSIALYGSGQNEINASLAAKVYVGTFLNIWLWVHANATVSYDIRLIDYTVYLPWAVALTNAAGNTYVDDTLRLSLTDVNFNYTTSWWI